MDESPEGVGGIIVEAAHVVREKSVEGSTDGLWSVITGRAE